MAVRGGQMLHYGQNVLLSRIQTSTANVEMAPEQVYELGNYESVETVYGSASVVYGLSSYDTSTEFEKLLTGGVESESYDLTTARAIDIKIPFKKGKDDPDKFEVAGGGIAPALMPESITYRFGAQDNAMQECSLRGSQMFYGAGSPRLLQVVGTNTAGQVVVTPDPAAVYNGSGTPRRVLSVRVDNSRLTEGPDYTVTYGAVTGGYATATVTITRAVPVTSTVFLAYFTNVVDEFPQSVHPSVLTTPGAVRGRDIKVFVGVPEGTFDATDPLTYQTYLWSGVNSVEVQWQVTLDESFELGSADAVERSFDVPTLSGSFGVDAKSVPDLMERLRTVMGETDPTAVIGADVPVPFPVDIVVYKPGTNFVMKRLHLQGARFTLPGVPGTANQKSTTTMNFSDDKGRLVVYRDSDTWPDAPVITTTSLGVLEVGTPASVTLVATGGAVANWAVTAGALPTGLVLNGTTGVVSGTPTVDGAYTVTITATYVSGSDDQEFTGTVDV